MKNIICAFSFFLLYSCTNSKTAPVKENDTTVNEKPAVKKDSVRTENRVPADAATIMARQQVPVLCYHHIRDIQMPSRKDRGYEVTLSQFKAQMKALSDSGYQTVLPDQLYEYLVYGAPLPPKPVMLTYDDTSEEHFTIAKQEMEKYGFKGVFFLMTISIDRPRYMTKAQIKQLADDGHAVASHTWDHHRVDRYKSENTVEERGVKKVMNDWEQQLGKSKQTIEAITGKPVVDFAYPFGIWSKEGIPEIKKQGYRMAFQLSTKRDSLEPLHTVRRMIVSPEWSAEGMIRVMNSTFSRW
ncbi:MAG TPA: polysaccharide deacetylase family protein [Flavisolibacter sp.]|jgi:peptidoglycan/xylan/chitin deacetylase (PgdA/CDA1 family)|nr:polysaccharide deacetylase family protein [Flavisolibacter sp.]